MPRLTRLRIEAIQHDVLGWYAIHKRDLPWRHTTDPYRILVSEIMLQQTQVSRVTPKYDAFLAAFPTSTVLAAASPATVVIAWKGLGYNRRALNLQRAAQRIEQEFQGQFPTEISAVRSLPGIGRYTAGAVMSFAYNQPVAAVDTNVKRFLDHAVPTRTPRRENDYYELAAQLIPTGRAREWLHAVMDYASLVLRPQQPRNQPTKPAEPFVGSNRYLRGQTIDRLRTNPQTLDELFTRIGAPIDVELPRFAALIHALEHEGFIEERDGLLQLRSTVS